MENYVAASCKIHGDIYISNTREELREYFNKHRTDAKNRPDNNNVAILRHKYTLTRVFKFKRNPIGNIKMESTSKI